MVSKAPELPNQEEALKAIPRDQWTRQNEDMFCAIVADRQRADASRGVAKKTCEEFSVKPGTYNNWRTRFMKGATTTSNGDAKTKANGDPTAATDTPLANTPPPDAVSLETFVADEPVSIEELVETPAPEETIAADQAVVRNGIERLMDDIDQLAMRLETENHPLAEALGYQILSVRLILTQLNNEGVVLEESVKPTAASELAREFSAMLSDSHVEPDVPLEETIIEPPAVEAIVESPAAHPTPIEEIPQPTPEPPQPIAEAPTVSIADEIIAATTRPVTPPPVRQRLSRDEALVAAVNASLGLGLKTYDRALEHATEEFMKQFDQHHGDAGWLERENHEKRLREWLGAFDPNQDGSLRGYVARKMREAYRSSKAPALPRAQSDQRQYSDQQRYFHLKQHCLRKAFELAERIHRSRECPPGIPYDRLKTAAFRSFKPLVTAYDGDDRQFWQWAEPLMEQSIRAELGLCEPPMIGATALVVETEQLPLIEVAMRNSMKKLQNWRNRHEHDDWNAAFVEWVKELAQYEGDCSFMQAADVVLKQYRCDIERLTGEIDKRTNGKHTIAALMESLSDSVTRSIRNFNTYGRTGFGDFVMTGLEATARRWMA